MQIAEPHCEQRWARYIVYVLVHERFYCGALVEKINVLVSRYMRWSISDVEHLMSCPSSNLTSKFNQKAADDGRLTHVPKMCQSNDQCVQLGGIHNHDSSKCTAMWIWMQTPGWLLEAAATPPRTQTHTQNHHIQRRLIVDNIACAVIMQVTDDAECRRITPTVDLNNIPENLFPTAPVTLVIMQAHRDPRHHSRGLQPQI